VGGQQDVQSRGIDEYGIAQVEDHIAGTLADDAIQLRSELRAVRMSSSPSTWTIVAPGCWRSER
jgi:hypothetical protein